MAPSLYPPIPFPTPLSLSLSLSNEKEKEKRKFEKKKKKAILKATTDIDQGFMLTHHHPPRFQETPSGLANKHNQ